MFYLRSPKIYIVGVRRYIVDNPRYITWDHYDILRLTHDLNHGGSILYRRSLTTYVVGVPSYSRVHPGLISWVYHVLKLPHFETQMDIISSQVGPSPNYDNAGGPTFPRIYKGPSPHFLKRGKHGQWLTIYMKGDPRYIVVWHHAIT